ncbi:MAG: outer membrane protein assembly factor BamB [Methylophilaceae bacterium]
MLNSLYKKTITAMLVICLLSLTACGTFSDLKTDVSEKIFGREPVEAPEPLAAINETASSKMIWQAKVGTAEDFEFSPAVEAGFVYAAGANGELIKIDVLDGKQVWRTKTGEKISGGVGAGGSLVMVGTQNGGVYAFDTSGKLLWKSKLSSEVLSAPKYFDGTVIVRTGDSRIYGINADDGSRKWVYERANPALTLRSSAGVIVDGGAVYAGFGGGKMVAVRADNGKLLWEASVAQPKGVTEIERIADITSLPAVDGPLVYAAAYQGRVAAIDRVSGRVVWNQDVSSLTGLNVEDGRIFVSHANGSVYALDYTTGKIFWQQAGLKNRQLTAPVPMGSYIAVGDVEGYLHFLSRDDGAFISRIKIGNSAVMPQMMLINSNTVLAQTRDGGLYAVQVK